MRRGLQSCRRDMAWGKGVKTTRAKSPGPLCVLSAVLLGAGAGAFTRHKFMQATGQSKDAPVRARAGPRLGAEGGWRGGADLGLEQKTDGWGGKYLHCLRAALTCTTAPGHREAVERQVLGQAVPDKPRL